MLRLQPKYWDLQSAIIEMRKGATHYLWHTHRRAIGVLPAARVRRVELDWDVSKQVSSAVQIAPSRRCAPSTNDSPHQHHDRPVARARLLGWGGAAHVCCSRIASPWTGERWTVDLAKWLHPAEDMVSVVPPGVIDRGGGRWAGIGAEGGSTLPPRWAGSGAGEGGSGLTLPLSLTLSDA